MQSLRASLSSRIRLGMGTNALPPIQRMYIKPLALATTRTARATGLRNFSLSRLRWKEAEPLERLEIREGEQLQGGKSDKETKLEDFNKGMLS